LSAPRRQVGEVTMDIVALIFEIIFAILNLIFSFI
jgi:hypothetical protein